MNLYVFVCLSVLMRGYSACKAWRPNSNYRQFIVTYSRGKTLFVFMFCMSVCVCINISILKFSRADEFELEGEKNIYRAYIIGSWFWMFFSAHGIPVFLYHFSLNTK